MPDTTSYTAVVTAEGHLVDSQILTAILDTVIQRGGAFQVLQFDLGRTNDDFSRLTLRVSAGRADTLAQLLEELIPFGCRAVEERDALVRVADRDGCVPDDFYATTNLRTHVRIDR